MIQRYRDLLQIYFGDRHNEISMEDIEQARYCAAFKKIMKDLSLDKLIVLNQQHTDAGVQVTDNLFDGDVNLFSHQGDFLVTDMKNCGLVVLTADCLPVVIYDSVNHVAGIAHAGWRGSVQGVVLRAIELMQNQYGSSLESLKVFFGASAKNCCYEVGEEFLDHFVKYEYADKAFIKRNNKLYFDNKQFVDMQLVKLGLLQDNIYNKRPMCTICCNDQISFRREKHTAGRQATVVALL